MAFDGDAATATARQRRLQLLADSSTRQLHRLRQYYRLAAEGGQAQADRALADQKHEAQLRSTWRQWRRQHEEPRYLVAYRVDLVIHRSQKRRVRRAWTEWERQARDQRQLLLAACLAKRTAQTAFLAGLGANSLLSNLAFGLNREAIRACRRGVMRRWHRAVRASSDRRIVQRAVEDAATTWLAVRRWRRWRRAKTPAQPLARLPDAVSIWRARSLPSALLRWQLSSASGASLDGILSHVLGRRRARRLEAAMRLWHREMEVERARTQEADAALAALWLEQACARLHTSPQPSSQTWLATAVTAPTGSRQQQLQPQEPKQQQQPSNQPTQQRPSKQQQPEPALAP